jgi:carnitine O-acetyltransferase
VAQAEIKTLPRLPIPPLDETLKRFLEYVEPLVSPDEMKETVEVVKQFAMKEGPSLDAQLRSLREQAETSWLEGMWDTSYLEYRERTPLNVSPAFMLENEALDRNTNQIDRAARLLEATGKWTASLRNGTLEVDKEGDKPICMHQYTKLLGSARLPVFGRDVLVQCHTATHVIVLSKRQFYVLDILTGSGEPVPAQKLAKSLKLILADSDACTQPGKPMIPNVSILTSEHRDTWADVYPEVEALNKATLQAIHDSILVLVLDPQSPADVDAAGAATLHNMGESRWFDKSVQLIVYKNAIAGLNMEHAGYDGQTLIRFFGDLALLSAKLPSVDLSDSALATDSSNTQHNASAPEFSKLTWQLNEKIHVAMGRAQRDLEEAIYKMDLKTLNFTKFGKKAITKHKISPDAFAQAALHLAYFRTFGANRSAYESCAMKRFYHGRTEVIRSLTAQLHQFIGLTRCPPSTAQQQQDAARKAFEAHVNRAKQCQQGNGVDRHLWGMLQLANHRRQHVANYQIPKLYSLPAWKRMRHDHLSTSNCGNEQLSYFGFGPTWTDGLGIGYIIKNNSLIATVSSYEHSSPRYVTQLEKAFQELLDLFENNTPIRSLQAKL